jgi:hypothetical protein
MSTNVHGLVENALVERVEQPHRVLAAWAPGFQGTISELKPVAR